MMYKMCGMIGGWEGVYETQSATKSCIRESMSHPITTIMWRKDRMEEYDQKSISSLH